MDNFNLQNLIALVMSIAAPCALFLIIINTSRAILQQQIWTSLAITLTFAVLLSLIDFLLSMVMITGIGLVLYLLPNLNRLGKLDEESMRRGH